MFEINVTRSHTQKVSLTVAEAKKVAIELIHHKIEIPKGAFIEDGELKEEIEDGHGHNGVEWTTRTIRSATERDEWFLRFISEIKASAPK